ncbi:hypothetical protein LINPERHAP1_LOCUS17342, partial [Linum perenne]
MRVERMVQPSEGFRQSNEGEESKRVLHSDRGNISNFREWRPGEG